MDKKIKVSIGKDHNNNECYWLASIMKACMDAGKEDLWEHYFGILRGCKENFRDWKRIADRYFEFEIA